MDCEYIQVMSDVVPYLTYFKGKIFKIHDRKGTGMRVYVEPKDKSCLFHFYNTEVIFLGPLTKLERILYNVE
jgi:hypothetical protein